MTTAIRHAIIYAVYQITGSIMSEVEEQIREEVEIKEPNLWRVIFHNDDKTTMEFVMFLLIQIFHKSMQEATEITLEVHNKNAATVGVYTHEIAENKMNLSTSTARQEGFPLNVSIEEEV